MFILVRLSAGMAPTILLFFHQRDCASEACTLRLLFFVLHPYLPPTPSYPPGPSNKSVTKPLGTERAERKRFFHIYIFVDYKKQVGQLPKKRAS
ncbi:hypothetical protein CDAR_379351 [Caerostris darwini]|uniref:Secreted protein n=1 Tax=Caerostris darwini TaxID=1538125 RepID=A0AAV4VBB6_9ARAC|nr:hypothetical protein CDAR_379351 [Caerostris darwini]